MEVAYVISEVLYPDVLLLLIHDMQLKKPRPKFCFCWLPLLF